MTGMQQGIGGDLCSSKDQQMSHCHKVGRDGQTNHAYIGRDVDL